MVVLTRAVSRQIRDHLVSTMLDGEGKTMFNDVLTNAGIEEFEDLTSMTDLQVDRLMVTTVEGETRTRNQLNDGVKNKIKLLIKWLAIYQQQQQNLGISMTSDNWLTLTNSGLISAKTAVRKAPVR